MLMGLVHDNIVILDGSLRSVAAIQLDLIENNIGIIDISRFLVISL